MKVKVISRNPDDYLRETKNDIHKTPRNFDPSLHQLESVREYVRALNATKLERVFAKPFIGVLSGHREGICCFGKHPQRLSTLCSGAYDGEIYVWDLPTRKCLRNFVAHEGFVRGIAFPNSGDYFLSVGDDKTIKCWKSNFEDEEDDETKMPTNVISSPSMITGLTHHRKDTVFATCGDECLIWDKTRNEPLKSLDWGVDSLNSIAFNPIEVSLLGACASDRSIIMYDTRETKPLRKITLAMRSNKLVWNPMEAFNFTVANEDYNLYTYDMRKLKSPYKIHYDHVSAVIDVDYSPTGKEFVSGSYDKTVRIYEVHQSHSRDIYHTKRMQHVTCTSWSLDNTYVLSGSDEMNIRLWKSQSSHKLGVIQPRERMNFNYQQAMKQRFAAHPQIRAIAKHRQVPKFVHKEQKRLRIMKMKQKRKEYNIKKHSNPNAESTNTPENEVVTNVEST